MVATHIRMKNVEAAMDAGIVGIQFKNVTSLRQDLALLGIDFSLNKDNEDPAEHKAEYFPWVLLALTQYMIVV